MHGLKSVTEHQCKYQYADKSYCGNTINYKYYDNNKLDYCIYHAYNDNKLVVMSRDLENMINEKNKVIREEIKQRNLLEKENDKEINEIRHKNQIVLEGAYFPNGFRLVSDPLKMHIEADISFYHAFFAGKFFPLNTIFKGKAGFIGATFAAFTNFNDVVFHNDANFNKTSFNETALFINTVFKAKADFMDTNFNCETEFFRACFEQNANFLIAKFHQVVFFKYATFQGKTDFVRVLFSDEADFQHSIFKGETNFHDTIFRKKVSLLFTTFLRNSDFENAIFERDTDFRGSLFVKGASFQNVKFLSTLDFSFAAFLGGTLDFSYASFMSDDTRFTHAIFNCAGYFNNLLLKGVRFTGCYLGGCSFRNSDIRDAVFIDCSWDVNYLKRQSIEFKSILSSTKERKWILDKNVIIKEFNPGYLPEHKTRKIILYDEIIYSRMKKIARPSFSEKAYRFLIQNLLFLKIILLFITALIIISTIFNNIIISLGLSFFVILITWCLYSAPHKNLWVE